MTWSPKLAQTNWKYTCSNLCHNYHLSFLSLELILAVTRELPELCDVSAAVVIVSHKTVCDVRISRSGIKMQPLQVQRTLQGNHLLLQKPTCS